MRMIEARFKSSTLIFGSENNGLMIALKGSYEQIVKIDSTQPVRLLSTITVYEYIVRSFNPTDLDCFPTFPTNVTAFAPVVCFKDTFITNGLPAYWSSVKPVHLDKCDSGWQLATVPPLGRAFQMSFSKLNEIAP